MTTKKDDNNDSVTVQSPELENVFNFDKEQACYDGQTMDTEGKVPFYRWPPVEQMTWENFRARCIEPSTGRWYTSGDGTGICKGKVGPSRKVTSIIRMKTADNSEYLLSSSKITGYNAYGDIQEIHGHLPEKYNRTTFRYDTVPNYDTGFSERRNMGPSGSSVVYTLPFSVEAAKKLFDQRENDEVVFIVKYESTGNVYSVRQQQTVQDTFKLFTENSFEYLYNANYLSISEKEELRRKAEAEGLAPKLSSEDRHTNISAQANLTQSDKMASYQ